MELQSSSPGKTRPPDEGLIQFPITDDDPKFRAAMKKYCLDFLPAEMWAALESVQTHKRQNPHTVKMAPLLRILRELENRDKHRLLRLVRGQVHKSTIDELPTEIATLIDSFQIFTGPLEDCTEVMSFTTSKPTPDVKYKIIIELAVCIPLSNRPSDFIEVVTLNGWLVEEVSKVIDFIVYAAS